MSIDCHRTLASVKACGKGELGAIEGEYEVYGQDEDGEKYAIEATPGTTVHVPGNVPHGFKNVGNTTGKLLAL